MTNEPSDSVYEMAEQAWNECWPPEPTMSVAMNSRHLKTLDKEWLIFVFTNIVNEYDGPVCDIADHLGDFGDKWIEKKAEGILEDARNAEAEARADAAEFDRDYREDW